MDELVVIELLRKVILGKRKEKLPPNSVEVSKIINTVIDPEPSSSNQIRRSKNNISTRQTRWPHCILSSKRNSIHPILNNQQ